MSKPIVALLFAFPLSAGAVPVTVEYEGTINAVNDLCWCEELGYQLGDRIAGVLEIDTDRAVDSYDLEGRASYSANGEDFISGGGPAQRPGHPMGADNIFVQSGYGDRVHQDFYSIWDHTRIPGGGNNTLEMQITSLNLDFLHDKGLVQSFDSRAMQKEGDVRFFASMYGQLQGMTYRVGIALTRMKVTPGVCHAP